MLDEIKDLYKCGKPKEALELLDTYLRDCDGDIEALQLKVDWSLAERCNLSDVSAILAQLEGYADPQEVKALRERAEKLVCTLLEEGRSNIRSRDWTDALADFKSAVDLSAEDPAVLFSAGVALCGLAGKSDDYDEEEDYLPRGFPPLRVLSSNRPAPTKISTEGEKYLSRAIKASPPGSSLYHRTLSILTEYWLDQSRVRETLALLEDQSNLPEPVTEQIARRIVMLALDRVVLLLRADRQELAGQVLRKLAAQLPDIAALQLLKAEWLNRNETEDGARRAYQRAIRLTKQALPVLGLGAARAAWTVIESHPIVCARCGKPLEVGTITCAYCGQKVDLSDLLVSRFSGELPPEAVIAHAGIAALAIRQGKASEARRHLELAFALLPEEHAALQVLSEMSNELANQTSQSQETATELAPAPGPGLALTAVNDWIANGLTSVTLNNLARTVTDAPGDWAEVRFATRRALIQKLLAEGYLKLACSLMGVIFADNPRRKTVQTLKNQLATAVAARVTDLLDRARSRAAERRWYDALDLADQAVELDPHHVEARLARGEAALATKQAGLAFVDYYAAWNQSTSGDDQRRAQLGVAAAFEQRHDIAEALDVLEDLAGEDVDRIRTRLHRLQSHEPVITVEQVSGSLIQDTLIRADSAPCYHAYFAVALRSIGRPWGVDSQAWQSRVLTAGFEFVQVLGGLRNAIGSPVAALRLISQPDPAVPERGQLVIALVMRVSAPDAASARNQATGLWHTLRNSLPLEQEHVFNFVPVVDEAELARLLTPFPASRVAQIVRREDMIYEAGGRYVVYPFTPGTTDMHNVCWALLRQPEPAMISIHLLPTELLPWERTALEEVMRDQRVMSMAQTGRDENYISRMDPVAERWNEVGQAGATYTNRYLLDSLSPQAYVMQINVATSTQTDDLLPERVASALLGPARLANSIWHGGYEIIRTVNGGDLEAARRNLETLDVEAWVYSAAPAGAPRLRYMVSESEAALAFRLPIPDRDGVPGLPLVEARPVAPPPGMPQRGSMLGRSVARVNGLPVPVIQRIDDRRRHTYVVGKTGTGKTTLLKNLILQDIEAGHGVAVIDPHGDLIEDILLRVPPYRVQDVILFDPSDEERPIGLNMLQARSEPERQRIINEFLGLLIRMFDPQQSGIVGPRFQHNVRNAMLTAMSIPGSTLIEVVRILTSSEYTRSVLPYVTDPIVQSYWRDQIAHTSDFHKSEILDYVVSKFSPFVGDSRVRNIIGQHETTVDFRQVMDRQQILLVNLSKGKIGPESALFLGQLMVQSLLVTALSRSDAPLDRRPDFFLYVDEFQNFATDLFGVMLSEGRKYGIAIIMANQYLTQLDHSIREAVFGNVGTLVSFRLGVQDAVALTPEMYPVFSGDDLVNLPKFTACIKLLLDGTAARPFTMETYPDTRRPDPNRAAVVREHSRQTYGRDAAAISKEIMGRYLNR